MLSVNTWPQEHIADVIIDLINHDEIRITHTVIDCFDDRKFFMFVLFLCSTGREICMLQQIEHTYGETERHIYFNGKRTKWDKCSVQHLLDVAFEKVPDPTPIKTPKITVVV